MESSAVRVLFRSIMKAPQSPPRDLEIISLMYPVTMEELSNPVRNRGCRERSCIWPLDSLLKQAEQQARKGVLRQGDLLGSIFTCEMCSEETKFARRSFNDFYFDRKLDYLIRAAKIKYMQTFTQEELKQHPKAKERAEKGFKQCKLFIHRGGSVMLEYKKKLSEGVKVTYHTLVFQDTANSSQQLSFNPKDYSKNLSALKIAQGLAERSLGDQIDRGLETVSLCYSKKYQQKLQRLLTDWILENIKQHTETKNRDEVFSATLATTKILQTRTNVELILFYPRYNLTQIYTFDQCQDILSSCNNDGVLICKLEDHRILIYTSDHSYIIKLEPISLKRTQIVFNREIEIKGQRGQSILKRNASIQIKYMKQVESYHHCPKDYLKFASVRPTIENPIIIQNPKNIQEAFLVGGVVQGLRNYFVYRLKDKQWQQQKNQVKWEGSLLLSIIQGEQIFALGLVELLKTQKDKIYRLFLHQINISQNQLKVTKIHDLCQTKNNHLLPLRTNQNHYMLVDFANKASPIYLSIRQRKVLEGPPLKEDISKFLRELYDIRNQKTILQSYPTCSVTYNQVTYNLLSSSIAKNAFKILYGCGNQWRISGLSQKLLRE